MADTMATPCSSLLLRLAQDAVQRDRKPLDLKHKRAAASNRSQSR